MKILSFIVDIDKKSGGPSRSVPMMAKGLAKTGNDITLMTFRSNEMNIEALQGTPVELKILEQDYSIKEIENYITTESFDIIQLQSIWHPSYHRIAKICRKHDIPYLITPRGMLEPWSLSQKKWKKKLALLLYQMRDLNKASCIYTTSEMEASNVKQLGVKSNISVIPNGIDINGYPCRSTRNNIKKQILFLSRIHEKKGIELLINAWKTLHAEYPDWSIKIVGNGEDSYIKKLKETISKHQLDECIEIMPPAFGSSKIALYQSSSLFVLPSYSENFGMVIAEALSCGVPVITTNYTPWEFLNSTNTGWCIGLSEDNLKNSLREALNRSLDELYEMGQRGSQLVGEKFDYRSVAIKTINLYDWLLYGGDKPNFVL